jgi:2-polyprenyl-3-methyl-5-hydroxy-6-metoxy-1,4-benzoquinol methylase
MSDVAAFWEARAARFAGEGKGLRAVCSYAMPGFYNRAIDLTQRCALSAVLRSIEPGSSILDYGCGIGRWSRAMARRGCEVVGMDFSAAMLRQAEERTAAAGLAPRCRFLHRDVSSFDLGRTFDVVFGVTVLQHVIEPARFSEALACLARHVRPGGRLVLLEAAPTRAVDRAETATFRARTLPEYLEAIAAAGLHVEAIRGVDPMPFKVWVIPRFARWHRAMALAALAFAVAFSLPLDLSLAHRLTRSSWHKIIVARTPERIT